MLFFLPVALVVFGRWIFWPRLPHVDHAVDIATHGVWGQVAAGVGRHPRRVWAVTAVVLFGAVALVPGLRTNGLQITDGFTNTPDAVVGQHIYDAKFDQGAGTPAVITANAGQAAAVIDAAAKVKGVATSAAGSRLRCSRTTQAGGARSKAAAAGRSSPRRRRRLPARRP